jgi:hypothetical protein
VAAGLAGQPMQRAGAVSSGGFVGFVSSDWGSWSLAITRRVVRPGEQRLRWPDNRVQRLKKKLLFAVSPALRAPARLPPRVVRGYAISALSRFVASVFGFFFGELGREFEPRRVRGGVDLLEHPDGDLRVNLGGLEFGVTKQLLDEADVCGLERRSGAEGTSRRRDRSEGVPPCACAST